MDYGLNKPLHMVCSIFFQIAQNPTEELGVFGRALTMHALSTRTGAKTAPFGLVSNPNGVVFLEELLFVS